MSFLLIFVCYYDDYACYFFILLSHYLFVLFLPLSHYSYYYYFRQTIRHGSSLQT
jgi:hypothetical protein